MRQQTNRPLSGNSFDDAIFDTPRFRRAVRGHIRELGLRRFDNGGDWETLCRAAALLARLYVSDERGDAALLKGCIKAANMCAGRRRVVMRTALGETMGIERLDWSIDVPCLYGWSAVLKTVGATAYDAKLVFFDRYTVQQALTRAFNSFDDINVARYTSSEVVKRYFDDLELNNRER